jgi:hypothetical protein
MHFPYSYARKERGFSCPESAQMLIIVSSLDNRARQEFRTEFYAIGDFLGKTTGYLSFCIVYHSPGRMKEYSD